jgi:hypothetical protein
MFSGRKLNYVTNILKLSKNNKSLSEKANICLFPLEKIDAFSLISPYFSRVIFTSSENATKFKEASKFRQETLNILSMKKFAGSHLAFYE